MSFNCPNCGSNDLVFGGDDHITNAWCKVCETRFTPGTVPPIQKIQNQTSEQLKRIADSLEKIERHMAYNNGTLEGLTRNYDPNLFRK